MHTCYMADDVELSKTMSSVTPNSNFIANQAVKSDGKNNDVEFDGL